MRIQRYYRGVVQFRKMMRFARKLLIKRVTRIQRAWRVGLKALLLRK